MAKHRAASARTLFHSVVLAFGKAMPIYSSPSIVLPGESAAFSVASCSGRAKCELGASPSDSLHKTTQTRHKPATTRRRQNEIP
jgi:hypothetical protein